MKNVSFIFNLKIWRNFLTNPIHTQVFNSAYFLFTTYVIIKIFCYFYIVII